jgi:serine/threonine protein kinase/Tol biopolymer transport system component
MTLTPGTRFGPYEVVALIGAGGMGEVYRARDTRLDRDVAIKVLPAHLSANPETRARFEREARAISHLSHPHICTLYDIGCERPTAPGPARSAETSGLSPEQPVHFLVMEYLEGETLAARLAHGPLPLPEVLRYGTAIASALDAAHRSGIVHRDLKPANVMLVTGGTARHGAPQAKLMDFGLARPVAVAPGAVAPTDFPTVSRPLTAEGSIVGTLQYMAPEQLEGKEADARSDLWALGCVLYEMATGKPAFAAPSQASLIAAILKETPRPLVELQPLTPPALERVVRQCLEKDPGERWQSAHDIASELGWVAQSAVEPAASLPSTKTARRTLHRWVWAAAGLMAGAALALGAAALWRSDQGTEGEAIVHAAILHEGEGILDPGPANVAISPDGRRIVYIVNQANDSLLWIRDLDRQTSRRLSDLHAVQFPFWSPDGQWVAFFTMSDPTRVWKVPAAGGAPVSLCDVTFGLGGAWGRRDVIVFAPTGGGPLYRVPAAGGPPEPVTSLDAERHQTGHRMPWFLPDGDHFLFVALPRVGPNVEIFAGSLGSTQVKRIMAAASGVTYAEPGYLLFERDQKLVAQRFDPSRLELAGEPVPIGDPPLAESSWEATWIATASVDGRLASLRSWPRRTEVEWVDRVGRAQGGVPLPAGRWEHFALAPDGQSVLARRPATVNLSEAWLFDTQGVKAERVSQPQIMNPELVWAPDARSFLYSSSQAGRFEVYRQQRDSTNAPQLIPTVDAQFKSVCSFTPDGGSLIIAAQDPLKGWALWIAPLNKERAPALLTLMRPKDTIAATVSPDGRWLVYLSQEAGQSEVYVTPFPAGGQRIRVSTSGGWNPTWVRGGRELLYLSRQGRDVSVMSVAVGGGPAFTAGTPRLIFSRRGLTSFASTGDGERLLLSVESGDTPPPYISLTLNWTDVLRHR